MHQNNVVEWGQHFLVDREILKEFLRFCRVSGGETVLEIGPGEGVITAELASQAKSVTAIEIDESLKPKLKELQKKYPNLNMHFGNALEWQNFRYDLVCGAISWAIFEPLMVKIFKDDHWQRGVFLVSAKTKKTYQEQKGLLGHLLNAFFTAQFSDTIPQEKFNPAPSFLGVVIALSRKTNISSEELFWQELFRQGDKKLKNSLREALIKLNLAKTKNEARQKIGNLPKDLGDKTIWQLTNESFGKINEIIVYSLHAQS